MPKKKMLNEKIHSLHEIRHPDNCFLFLLCSCLFVLFSLVYIFFRRLEIAVAPTKEERKFVTFQPHDRQNKDINFSTAAQRKDAFLNIASFCAPCWS